MSDRSILVSLGDFEHDKGATYVNALVEMGVAAERIRLVLPGDGVDFAALAAGAAGLVLCGGDDIEPHRYSEETIAEAHVEPTPARDAMEFPLLLGARSGKTPVWAICRGLQVVNVFHGGTLYQDLTLQRPSAVPHSITEPQDAPAHGLAVIDAGHRLGSVLAGETKPVNSRHHQGIKDLGAGLLPVASSPDGLVEAIATADSDWWVRAVQWHPENLTAHSSQRALWRDFVTATEARR